MIWGKTYKQRYEIREKKYKWHKWFAWFPVKLGDGRYCFLEYCLRRLDEYNDRDLLYKEFTNITYEEYRF